MWESLRTVRKYLWRYRRGMALGGLCLVMKDLAQALQPLMIRGAVDSLPQRTRPSCAYAGLPGRPRAAQRHLPILDARDPHRHLPRYRIRPAQRSVRPPDSPLPRILRAHAHRRHHGARHQRPQRRPHDARSGRDVLVRNQPDVHAGHRHHDARRLAAGDVRRHARARGQPRRHLLRPRHSRPLREDPGDVLRYLQPRAGEPRRRAHDPRLRAGEGRDAPLRGTEPAVHRAEHPAGAHPGPLRAAAGSADRR